jgi:hypothetical protein
MGGLMLVEEIPTLCRDIYVYATNDEGTRLSEMFQERLNDMSYMLTTGAKILIALIIIGNQREIVNFIERKRRKVSKEAEEGEVEQSKGLIS